MRSDPVLRRRAGRVVRGVSRVCLALVLVLGRGVSARADEPAQPESKSLDDAAESAPERKVGDSASKDAMSPPGTAVETDSRAQDQDAESAARPSSSFDKPWAVDVHGFVSQGFMLSSGNNYLTASKRGSFEFNEAGINVTKGIGDRLRVGVQFFARDLGAVGNYVPRLDWFNLDYRFADWLGIRAGRLKAPFGLYNEVNDIDSARVPVLLPQSVYPILNRDILLAQTGGEIYGYLPMKSWGALEYRLYGGTLFIEPPVAKPPLSLKSFSVPYVAGGRLMWEAPIEGLRLGGSVQTLRFDTVYTLPAMAPAPPPEVVIKIPFVLWLGSFEYAAHDLLVAAEYGRWKADVDTTVGGANKVDTVVNERYYVMASYRLSSWFVPGVYYSHLIENVEKPNRRDNFQDDLALTFRFDLTAHWLLKLESHYMHGTLDLSPELNGGTTRDKLTRDWGVFFVKTTAYF